jgi:hypothetical protein
MLTRVYSMVIQYTDPDNGDVRFNSTLTQLIVPKPI